MSSIQNISHKLKEPSYFVPLVILAVIVCFFTLIPKFTSSIYPQKRAAILNQFIDSTRQNKFLDSQEYWKFREFYSPGYYTFDRNGIEKGITLKFLNSINMTLNDKSANVFLKFTSPKLLSLDILTTRRTLSNAITENESDKNIIYKDPTTKIFREAPNTIVMLFLKTASDMKKANGFFDYQNEDKNITDGKYWLNITEIKTD
jgi:hypothetical protein